MAKTNLIDCKKEQTIGIIVKSDKKRSLQIGHKHVSWSDEQIKNEPPDSTTTTTTTGSTELSDPAILAVCDNPKYRYTRDELLKLRDTPLSQKKPDFLDINEVSPSIWDPNRWNSDNNRKKTDIPLENGSRTNDLLDHRRRPGERLRKDDGIVLCPQRRSFNSGCFVPVTRDLTRTNTTRPHSPLGSKSETSHLTGVRDIQTNNRRIGSGRILRDTWDFSDKTDTDNDYGFRNNTNQQQQQQQQRNNDDLNNRRTFGRDFDKDRRNNTNIINTNQQNRYNTERRRLNNNNSREHQHHHHNNHNHHDEPEWFYGGPSSQNDTIELRGFDDNEKLTTTNNNNNGNKKKMSPSQAKRARDWYKKKHENSSTTIPEEKDDNLEIKDDNIEDNIVDDKLKNDDEDDDGNNKKDNKNHIDDQCSMFEDILKADTIPGLPGILTNGVGGDSDGQSRFSKWFSKDNSSRNDSRRSSIQDDQQSLITQQFLSNILTDDATSTTSITTTTTTTTTTKGINVKINDDSNSYFAPISPAINHNHNNFLQQLPTQQTNKSINIMEMLQKTKQFDNNLIKPMHMPPGRIVNLADLEAKIRQNSEQLHKSHHHQQQQQKTDDDMSAFNQLLAQVSGGHIIPANGSLLGLQKPPQQQQQQQPPMSLMEMLNHSQQQDEARMAQMMCGPISPNLHPHLQQQQQQQQHNDLQRYHHLNKLNLMRSSPLMMDLGLQQSRELLNRPEAQAILQGLKVGDITLQHLHQQLANPALQPRHRELLYTILKQQQQNGVGNTNSNNNNSGGGNTTNLGASPRVLSPVPPQQQSYQQQQQQQQTTTPPSQQLRLSPLPPNAYCVSPIMATSPNTLTVPAMHQRIPSPRELQVHTQNILQRALIKKKLEEQQENYRKRQEMQQQQSTISTNTTAPTTITTLSSSSSSSSSTTTTTTTTTTKSVSSPTPLAFTPTSVLRKMTAEKDDKDFNKLVGGDSGKLSQGRAVTGIKQQSQQQQWGGFGLNLKQAGRPIVKANNYQPTQEQFYQQQQQQIFNQLAQEQQQQQQQQRKMMGQFPYNLMTTTTNSTTTQQHHPQYQNQFSQLTQQQLRAQHQQHARPITTTTTTTSTTTQSTQQFGGNWQQSNPTINQRSNQLIRNNDGGNDLTTPSTTTTTNQLTRWFSPDLLERARIGELPSTEELPQHCLSVEDIERISATIPQQPPPPVHN